MRRSNRPSFLQIAASVLIAAVFTVSCGNAPSGKDETNDAMTSEYAAEETSYDDSSDDASYDDNSDMDDESADPEQYDGAEDADEDEAEAPEQTYWFSGLTAEEITEQLTLEEKVRQMLQPGFDTANARKMKKWDFGSVFGIGDGMYSTAEEWREIVNRYQEAALASKTGLPTIYGQDDVHGLGYCSGAVVFPHNIGLGAAADPVLMYHIGAAVADEAKLTGMLWNFAPCVAVSTDPRWGRTYESLSSDPARVKALSQAYTEGLVDNGLVACAKHFFADGSETWGTGEDGNLIDRGDAALSDEEIQALLDVYQGQVDAGVQTIMLSHGSVNGVKMHENAEYIRILREEMGFDGMIVSDYESIHHISGDTFKEKLIRAINAGVDMLMEPHEYEKAYKLVLEAVREGSIPQERIDDAVCRILQVKIDAGLMDDPMQEYVETDQTEVGSSKYRALAEHAVEESMVLLKNTGSESEFAENGTTRAEEEELENTSAGGNGDEYPLLPLRKGMKVYVTGPAADDEVVQCGGWTKEWNSVSGPLTGVTTIQEGLEEVGEEQGITVLTDPQDAPEADVTLLFVGERTYAEWFGDSEDISLTGSHALEGNAAAIEEARRLREEYGIPTVACIVAGRQVIISDYLEDWDAAVMCYLPGSEGRGVANVLMGKAAFQGTLPMAWYASTEQIGSDECMFPVGYGMKTADAVHED